MPDVARYHLGRVIKLGSLTPQRLRDAIAEPTTLLLKSYLYTFTDIRVSDTFVGGGYVYARLTKYRPTGEVQVVLPEEHVAAIADIPNLLYASSPFVYLPEFGGIAYQNVPNRLPTNQFEKTFKSLVEEKFGGLFAELTIEPVADLRTFIQRVAQIEAVLAVEATVHPPNPLFNPIWASLSEYMRGRNAAEVRVAEEARTVDGLTSNLPRVARSALENPNLTPGEAMERLGVAGPGIADAAVLMAVDGYGRATIRGRAGASTYTVRTSSNQLSFQHSRDPDPDALATEARAIFLRINDERNLRHP